MSAAVSGLQALVDRELSSKGSVCVLEAGCGSASHLDFGHGARLVGIDISQRQLDRNALLHEKILGDIQHYKLGSEKFDVIVCWDVLEHLPLPELAMRNFSYAIKPGGLVILKLPNVLSVKGLVTKFLPHWVHVFAYRYFYGDREAGKNDNPPFKAYLRFRASVSGLQSQAAQLGLRSAYVTTFDAAAFHWLKQKRVTHFMYRIAKEIVGFLSFGQIGDSELVLVFRK
jgi:SAM-dependent methyltransferase